MYQVSDFDEIHGPEEREMVSALKEAGLNIDRNPLINFNTVSGMGTMEAKVTEINKMLRNANDSSYISALQEILNSRDRPQIKPGDHEKAMSRIQKSDSDPDSDPDPGGNVSTSSGDTSSSTSTSKGKTQVKQTTSSKSTILGMKPMYVYIGSAVLAALIAAAIYYSMK